MFRHLRPVAAAFIAAIVCLAPLIPTEHWHLDADQIVHHRHLEDDDHAAELALESAGAEHSTTLLRQTYVRGRAGSVEAPVATLASATVVLPVLATVAGHCQRDPGATHDPPLRPGSPRAPPAFIPARS